MLGSRVCCRKLADWVALLEQSAKNSASIPTIRQRWKLRWASSQNIIVEDEAAATRAIEFLKKNRAGRATFLPLTTIKPRQLPDHNRATIEKSVGFLGLASSLVSYESSLDSIFQNLLGTTAIFDTVEHARAAARQVRYQVRMVTLDGTELRTGGSYAGGATATTILSLSSRS